MVYSKKNCSNLELLDSALLDCYGRFVTLLPDDLLSDHVHLCFHLQEAYWWYCDKWQDIHPLELPRMKFIEFLELISTDCPILQKFISPGQLDDLIKAWHEYKRRIPLRGGILLNKKCNKVLLVQSYSSGNWTFPKGKTDQGEDDRICAGREIYEETSLSVLDHIHNDFYLEITKDEQNIKLFLVPGIDDSIQIKPKSSYEISSVRWFSISSLAKRNVRTYHVNQFLDSILEFIANFKKGSFNTHFPSEYQDYLDEDGTHISDDGEDDRDMPPGAPGDRLEPFDFGQETNVQNKTKLPRDGKGLIEIGIKGGVASSSFTVPHEVGTPQNLNSTKFSEITSDDKEVIPSVDISVSTKEVKGEYPAGNTHANKPKKLREIGTCPSLIVFSDSMGNKACCENCVTPHSFPSSPRILPSGKSKRNRNKNLNYETFGSEALGHGKWDPDEMFRINAEKFNVKSTFEDEKDTYKEKNLTPFNPDDFMSS